MKKIFFLLVFLTSFGLYLFSSAPALAPYRDMGEMVAVSKTLGVAHPPGYPTYTLMGRLSTLVPFSNFSYRLNLLSVIGGALSALFLSLLLMDLKINYIFILISVALWICSPGIWKVSIVTEMYSLNVAATFFLLFLSFKILPSLYQK